MNQHFCPHTLLLNQLRSLAMRLSRASSGGKITRLKSISYYLTITRFLYFITCFYLFGACEQVSDQDRALIDQVIAERVQQKISLFKESNYNRCLEGLYQKASEIADSILLLEARIARDSSNRPAKPIKPDKPEIIELNDSTPIQPFLQDTANKISEGSQIKL